MAKLPDFITAENELDGQEHVYIAQGGKTRKTLLQKIKEFVIGTNTMGTTATDVTGAVKELNDKIGSVEKEGSVIAHLNENTQNINNHKTESIYEQFTAIRDLTVEGIQTFALATNKIPKRIEIVATVGVPGTKLSNGSWSESGSASQSNMFTWGGASSMNFATTSNLLFISENSLTVATKADFHNRWAGGFDITWSKVGTGATGTATLLIKVSYHD